MHELKKGTGSKRKVTTHVTPTKVGVQSSDLLDSGFRRNDGEKERLAAEKSEQNRGQHADDGRELADPKNEHPFDDLGLGFGQVDLQNGQVGLGRQGFIQTRVIGFDSLLDGFGDFRRLPFVESGAKDLKHLEGIGVGHEISLAGGFIKVKETKKTAVWALKIAAFAGLWALFSAVPSWAKRGLSTKFAEVEVKNLKIGLSYSLLKTVNLPLRVSNTGSEPMELKVTVVAPKAGEGKPGYEPIPDTSWITLARSTFTVFPNMDAATDVFIHIPNDPKLLGRRFIAYLWTESQNKGFLGVGLKSRLLLSISSEKPTAAELKKKFIETGTANLNFSFAPMEVMAGNVPTGKTVKLSKFKADLKLANPNEAAYHFRLTPVGLWETSISVPSGFVPAPDPKWLIAPKPVFVAEPYSFNPLGLKVRIPNKPENRGKSFMLILRAEILEQNAPDYAYAKIFIRTKK